MYTAIYIRVSTEEQVREGFSIHAQKDKLSKYAEINDWTVVDYYVDDGISGKNLTERPEVIRLIEDVKLGKINNVLVYKLDRLTRSVKDLIYLIELFDKYKCTFNSQTEKIDTSNAVGRMFVKIIGIFAEFERENLAERVSLGYEQKTKEGNYTNTNGVFGYNYVVGDGKLEINELESKYVKKIYEWYLNGKSMLSIANKLRVIGVPTKRGGNWNQSTIYSILTNPLYVGIVRYGVHKHNGFYVDGKNIKPILEKLTYKNVQDLMAKRKSLQIRKYSSDDTYYFNVLRCVKCNKKYHARQQVQSGRKYISYVCNGYCNGTCSAKGFSHKKLEKAFLEYLDKIKDFSYDDEILNNKLINDDEILLLKRKINELNVKKSTNVELFVEDSIIDNKLNNLQDELKKLESKFGKINISKEQIIEFGLNIRNNFLHLTNRERKIFIERFIKEIKVKNEDGNVKIFEVLF